MAALCATVAITFMSHAIALMLVPLYAASLGASPALIGAIVASAALLTFATTMPIGVIVDRRDIRTLMRIGAVTLAVAPALGAVSANVGVLFVVQIGVSLGNLIVVLTSQSFVARAISATRRESGYGWMTMAVSAGQLVGPIAAGLIIEFVGFRAAFMLAAILPLFALRFASALSTRPSESTAPATRPSLIPDGAGAVLKSGAVRIAVGISFAVSFAQGAYIAFFAVYLDSMGYAATAVGALLSLRALTSMAVRPFMPMTVRLLRGREPTLAVMVIALVIGFIALGTVQAVALFAGTAILIGAAFGIAPPLSMAIVADHAPSNRHGLALSVRITANRLAQFAAPIGVGVVIQASSYGGGFVVTAIAVAVASLGAMVGSRSTRRAARSSV